jgi:V/A-type H+/Na+-transporting ATPase subunit D
MLRTLREHRAREERLVVLMTQAHAALRAALQRHGLETLQAWPAASLSPAAPTLTRTQFLGVARIEAAYSPQVQLDDALVVDPSPEATAARAAFEALLAPLATLAASTGNLQRLAAEYRRTERRARALENVLLPEIEQAMKAINEHLELADQEDAVRIRHAGR